MTGDPLEPLRAAIAAAKESTGDAPTRLATVAGVSQTAGSSRTHRVTVTFDGESAASTRSYLTLDTGAAVGDRVVMLAVGSTWVCAGVVGGTDTGYVNVPLAAGWANTGFGWDTAQYRRTGDILLLKGYIIRSGSTAAANSALTSSPLPTWARPFGNQVIDGLIYASAGNTSVAGHRIALHSDGHIYTLSAIGVGALVSLTSVVPLGGS